MLNQCGLVRIEKKKRKKRANWRVGGVSPCCHEPGAGVAALEPHRCSLGAYTPNGEFTVRSAYKVIMAISPSSNSGAPSDCWKQSTLWKTVWVLHVPNKIKAFTWWVCKNIFPTKVSLGYRRVIDNPVCEAYGLEAETRARVLAL